MNCKCENVGYINYDWLCLDCGAKVEPPTDECEYCGLIEDETCECWTCEHCMCKQDHEAHDDGCPAEGTLDDIWYGLRTYEDKEEGVE